MGFQGLGLNSRYTSVVQVNNNTEGTFQQESARTYDVGVTTSSDANKAVIDHTVHTGGFYNSNTYTVWSVEDVPSSDGSFTTYAYMECNDDVHSTDDGSAIIEFQWADGTSTTESYDVNTGGRFTFTTGTYNKYPVNVTMQNSGGNIDPANGHVIITYENGATSDYTVTGVTQE